MEVPRTLVYALWILLKLLEIFEKVSAYALGHEVHNDIIKFFDGDLSKAVDL